MLTNYSPEKESTDNTIFIQYGAKLPLTDAGLIPSYDNLRNGEKAVVSQRSAPFFNYAFAYFTGMPCRIQRRARRQLPDCIYQVNNNSMSPSYAGYVPSASAISMNMVVTYISKFCAM